MEYNFHREIPKQIPVLSRGMECSSEEENSGWGEIEDERVTLPEEGEEEEDDEEEGQEAVVSLQVLICCTLCNQRKAMQDIGL